MNRPLPAPSFTLDPEHVPAKLEQQVTPELIEGLARVRRQMFATPGIIDINALDPNERSADEKLQQLNDDQTWDSRSEGNWE